MVTIPMGSASNPVILDEPPSTTRRCVVVANFGFAVDKGMTHIGMFFEAKDGTRVNVAVPCGNLDQFERDFAKGLTRARRELQLARSKPQGSA